MKYELPNLPYDFAALEPHIDAKTMEIHHDKHHATYTNNLNAALEKHPEIADVPLADLLKDLSKVPEDIRPAIRNSGGGYFNHDFFWKILTPNQAQPGGQFLDALNAKFGSLDDFKKQFTDLAISVFGSGWAWLSIDSNKSLQLHKTPNQDTPLAENMYPILGLDVWEHAYYLKYKNVRADYLKAWWNVVNWQEINKRFER